MTGKIIFMKRICRADLKAAPESRFVFGDNLARHGHGGQAAAMRGEPNAIGVATKRLPSMKEGAFFSDCLDEIAAVQRDLAKIEDALSLGRTVVVPADGIGTGLAQLSTRSPKIWHIVRDFFAQHGAGLRA